MNIDTAETEPLKVHVFKTICDLIFADPPNLAHLSWRRCLDCSAHPQERPSPGLGCIFQNVRLDGEGCQPIQQTKEPTISLSYVCKRSQNIFSVSEKLCKIYRPPPISWDFLPLRQNPIHETFDWNWWSFVKIQRNSTKAGNPKWYCNSTRAGNPK